MFSIVCRVIKLDEMIKCMCGRGVGKTSVRFTCLYSWGQQNCYFDDRSHCKISRFNRQQLSTESKAAPPRPNYLNVFDRKTKLLQRKRAAHMTSNIIKGANDVGIYDYIKDEVSIAKFTLHSMKPLTTAIEKKLNRIFNIVRSDS